MTLPIYEAARTEAKIIANGIRIRLYTILCLDPIDYSKNENNPIAKKFVHTLESIDNNLEHTWADMDAVQSSDEQSLAEYRLFVKKLQGILNGYNDSIERLIDIDTELAEYIDYLQKRATTGNKPSIVTKNPSDITKNINGSVDNLKGAETVSLDDSGNIKPEDKK